MYEQKEGSGLLSSIIDRSSRFGSTLPIQFFLFIYFFNYLLPSTTSDLGHSVTFCHLSFHQSLRIKKKQTQLCNNNRLPLTCFLAPSVIGSSSSITSLPHCLHCQNVFFLIFLCQNNFRLMEKLQK